MNPAIEYDVNRATQAQLEEHLRACDVTFIPPLSERLAIGDYAQKLLSRAVRFEAWAMKRLVALVAVYCNDHGGAIAFITNVSVLPTWRGMGIASRLLDTCIGYVKQCGFSRIDLDVDARNAVAIGLYRQHGFATHMVDDAATTMRLTIVE